MLDEDKAYMSDILKAFDVVKFKLSETETRFKLIINPERAFTLQTLHDIQNLRGPVGIEIDVKNGVYLDCLKTGASRKRRRLQFNEFKGALPKKYECGKFNDAVREILSIEDVCEFDLSLDEDTLTISNLETISYPILKRIESTKCSVEIDMVKSELILRL